MYTFHHGIECIMRLQRGAVMKCIDVINVKKILINVNKRVY